jgi:hypothetical protein
MKSNGGERENSIMPLPSGAKNLVLNAPRMLRSAQHDKVLVHKKLFKPAHHPMKAPNHGQPSVQIRVHLRRVLGLS